MRNRKETIEHPGEVEKQSGNIVIVRIKPQTACATCKSQSYCGIAENTDKLVEVKVSEGKTYQKGEEVTICLKQSLGYRALLMGYLIPFLILVFVLIIMMAITSDELLSALTAITLMLPYYLLLYKYRDKVRETFNFKLKE